MLGATRSTRFQEHPMIRTIIHREYLVACDDCGRKGPSGTSLDTASQQARNEGWQSIIPLRGLEFLTTWLCPGCRRTRAALAG
jgi:hypothetical protein